MASGIVRPSRGEVHDVAHEVGRRIGGDGHVIAAARVPDEYIAGLQHGHDGVAPVVGAPLLVTPLAMARQVDGDRLVTQPLQLGDGPAPAPGPVETPVDQHEAHVASPLTREDP
jgi:hypothetical protein